MRRYGSCREHGRPHGIERRSDQYLVTPRRRNLSSISNSTPRDSISSPPSMLLLGPSGAKTRAGASKPARSPTRPPSSSSQPVGRTFPIRRPGPAWRPSGASSRIRAPIAIRGTTPANACSWSASAIPAVGSRSTWPSRTSTLRWPVRAGAIKVRGAIDRTTPDGVGFSETVRSRSTPSFSRRASARTCACCCRTPQASRRHGEAGAFRPLEAITDRTAIDRPRREGDPQRRPHERAGSARKRSSAEGVG